MMNDLPAQSYIIGFVSALGARKPDEWFLCMVGNGPGLFNHPGLW
jgi:hypothetical protein